MVRLGAYRFSDYVADVAAVIDALGWRAPAVIGHSLGGYVGANLAALHPMRVGSLVIADMLTRLDGGDGRARREARSSAPGRSSRAARKRWPASASCPRTRWPPARLAHLAEVGAVEPGPARGSGRSTGASSRIRPWTPGPSCPACSVPRWWCAG